MWSTAKAGVSASEGKGIFFPKSVMAGSLFSCIFWASKQGRGKGKNARGFSSGLGRFSQLALDVVGLGVGVYVIDPRLNKEVDATSAQEFHSQPQVLVASRFSILFPFPIF